LYIVPKKKDALGNQKFRLIVDYRGLDEITISDKFPIPNMDEILGKLGRCHQIEMDKNSINKTAFSTKNGHYM